MPDRQPTLRVAAMPSDANYTGDIFGGWLMGQVDIAGSIPAVHRAKGRVATVAVNSFVFKQPIFVGDIVSFYTQDRQSRNDLDHRGCRSLCAARSGEPDLPQSDRSDADLCRGG